MKTKQLIRQTLSRIELNNMKLLTTANIGMKLLCIFKNHIGNENSISRGMLFKKVFGREENVSLADELRWDYVKRAMHLCRKQTKCFIGSNNIAGVWFFFVLKDEQDAQYYIDNLERNIKAMRYAQRMATKSVENQHYKLNWIDDLRQRNKALIEQR